MEIPYILQLPKKNLMCITSLCSIQIFSKACKVIRGEYQPIRYVDTE